jgi:hypothetical protein
VTLPTGSIVHARYILQGVSDRADKYTFGWTYRFGPFEGGTPTPVTSDWDGLSGFLIAFLNTHFGDQTNPLAYYLSPSVSRASNACELTYTDISNDLGATEPAGSPFAIYPFTLGPSATAMGLPEQCCQTISWRAPYLTDPEYGTHLRPRADDRNRMYFGPISQVTTQADSETPTRVAFTDQFIADVGIAMQQTFDGLFNWTGGTGGATWWLQAWSRKKAEVQQVSYYSQQAYPTTQRRRIDKRPLLLWTEYSAP